MINACVWKGAQGIHGTQFYFWVKVKIISYIFANIFLWVYMLFLIELVAQNVVVGMVPTSPATILNGVIDETEIKTATNTCADAMMSAVVNVLMITGAQETVQK